MLRTQNIKNHDETTVNEVIRRVLQSVVFDVRTTISLVIKYSLGQMIWQRYGDLSSRIHKLGTIIGKKIKTTF